MRWTPRLEETAPVEATDLLIRVAAMRSVAVKKASMKTSASAWKDRCAARARSGFAEVRGVVMLSQSCDIVRTCRDRPFVEFAPLVERTKPVVEEIRRLKRPGFAYVPGTADQFLVADLDRTMTVEKALVSCWARTPGWETDEQFRNFTKALAHKRSRFAFPDDFVAAARKLEARLVSMHNKHTVEGAHLRALREIRVRAAPSWGADQIQLTWWFIKDGDPPDVPSHWPALLDQWLALFEQDDGGRFHLEPPTACRLTPSNRPPATTQPFNARRST